MSFFFQFFLKIKSSSTKDLGFCFQSLDGKSLLCALPQTSCEAGAVSYYLLEWGWGRREEEKEENRDKITIDR